MAKITGLDGMPIETEDRPLTLTLRYFPLSGNMKVDGDQLTIDQSINMLQQALRWFEARYVAYQHMKISQEIQRDQQLLEMTRQ